MICTFFGHRDTPEALRPVLRETILEVIERGGVDRFLVGNQGQFDAMALGLLREFERSHGVSYEVVLAYLPKREDPALRDVHTVLPEGIENVLPRFAIEYRNNRMLDQSDVVITYVTRSFGGAA